MNAQTATVSADRLHGLLRTEKAYARLKAEVRTLVDYAYAPLKLEERRHSDDPSEGRLLYARDAKSFAETLHRALKAAREIERTGETDG